MPPSKTISARRKLELSQLTPHALQREAMGTDVDIEKFVLYFSSQVKTDLVGKITDASITRSIATASSLKVTVNDYDRQLLTSGMLTNKLDVQLDGLWFRLAGVDIDGDSNSLDLTFEDREVAILRTYSKWKIARRSKHTRAEFVLNLIREVKEFHIPVVIPELHMIQPVERYDADLTGMDVVVGKSRGIIQSPPAPSNTAAQGLLVTGDIPGPPKSNPLTVKSVAANKDQIKNANAILSTGRYMGASRKVLVCSIMTAITESTLINTPGGMDDSVGLFQQRASWGSLEERMDPETSSRLFFNQIIPLDKQFPDLSYHALCQGVQKSAFRDGSNYAKWRVEADRFVTAFGIPGGNSESSAESVNGQFSNTSFGKDFFFYRGKIENRSGTPHRKPESSWTCIQRLSDEVDWRAFFVSGTFYFISEDDLIKQKPMLVFDEFMDGVSGVTGTYDGNKKSGQLSFTARVGRWNVPPGAVVVVRNMGPWNGRWLVSEYERSLFDEQAIVTLVKRRPRLPEPRVSTQQKILDTWFDQPSDNIPPLDQGQFGGIPGSNGSRDAVVKIAEYALQVEGTWHYNYAHPAIPGGRPYPSSLWSTAAHGDRSKNTGIDCSSFAILVYKEAGVVPDPSGNGYNGSGNTGSLITHGIAVATPQPGDLVFYGGSLSYPGHVAVFVGNGQVIEIGSEDGISRQSVNYRTPIAYRSYLPSEGQ